MDARPRQGVLSPCTSQGGRDLRSCTHAPGRARIPKPLGPWAPEQRPQSLIWTGRAVEMLWPSKYRCFGAMFGPAQGQMPFLTAKTADSGLEHKELPKRTGHWENGF